MKRESIIQILRQYNDWRRDNTRTVSPVHPIVFGEAIVGAIRELEDPSNLLIEFANFINTYPGLEGLRFDFMVIDFLGQTTKGCEHEFQKLDVGYTLRCRHCGLEP